MITIPSLSEIVQRVVVAARQRLPERSWRPRSDGRRRLEVLALSLRTLYEQLGIVKRDLLPNSSQDLSAWGEILSLPRKGATVAQRSSALRVTGAAATIVADDEPLTNTVTGVAYTIPTGGTIPAAGFRDFDVRSVGTGPTALMAAGESLTFDSPPAGADATTTLLLDLQGGEAEEQLEAYRARILARFVESDALITAADYAGFALAQDGVDSAYVYPLRNGIGTVDVAALKAGSGTVRVLTESERAALEVLFETARQVGIVGVRVLSVVTTEVDVDVTLKERSGVAWDWGEATSYEVDSYDSGTRTVTLTADRPADMEPGDRIVLEETGGNGGGEVLVVDAISGTDALVLAAEPSFTPGAGDLVHPAGPLTEPARDALLAFVDALGPALGEYGLDWRDTIDISQLEAAVFSAVPDVRDLTVVAPASDQEPEDPPTGLDSASVRLLIPGRVLVRRQA